MKEPQFIHPPVEGHLPLGYFQVFQVLVIVNGAVVSIWVQK